MPLAQTEPKKIYMGKFMEDMRGPCPEGFHIATSDEWAVLINIMTALGLSSATNYRNYLKIPASGRLASDTGNIELLSGFTFIWTNTNAGGTFPDSFYIVLIRDGYDVNTSFSSLNEGFGLPVRPYKDEPVIPDSSWTALYSNRIYQNTTLGLISLSSDGTNWVTIADKNLGAENVNNIGNYYQRGNNYGFPQSGFTTSATQVDASSYGPGNYYNSSTFITNNEWDSSLNLNLRGGITQRSGWLEFKRVYVGSTKVRPNIPATAISLNQSSITLTTVGQTSQLTATLTPSDSTSTVTWSSSNTSIATVSQSGLVTCVTPGSCTITATTDNGLTATCSIASIWYTPNTNTRLYLPLESDIVDMSGKTGRTFSSNGISYTTVGGVQSAHLSNTGYITLTAPKPLNGESGLDTTKLTLSVWFYVTTQRTSRRRSLLEFAQYGQEYIHMCIKENTNTIQVSNASQWYGSGTTITANSWINVIYTRNGTAGAIYINGTQKWSGTISGSAWGSRPNNFQNNQAILATRDLGNEALDGNAREVILEDKTWSSADAVNYFNSNKGHFGIN